MALPAIGAVIRALGSIDTILTIGKEVWEWATDEPVKEEVKEVVKKPRKKQDSTKFTQYQYDFIIHAHQEWKAHNAAAEKGMKLTQVPLVDLINEKMGTTKSVSALRTVWAGKVPRDTLAQGEPYFDY